MDSWIDQIMRQLKQLQEDNKKLLANSNHVGHNVEVTTLRVNELSKEVAKLSSTQNSCCQMLNNKLDTVLEMLQLLIPPPPGPAVGFDVTVESGPAPVSAPTKVVDQPNVV